MSLEDDTFSDSDRSSGDTYVYMGSSHCHGHSHGSTAGNIAALVLVLIVAAIIVAINMNGREYHGERRKQQTKAMIEAWARSMNTTIATNTDGTPGYSCKHEKSRALCDVRLTSGEQRHLQCGKGGCSER